MSLNCHCVALGGCRYDVNVTPDKRKVMLHSEKAILDALKQVGWHPLHASARQLWQIAPRRLAEAPARLAHCSLSTACGLLATPELLEP
jgi:DNA mismatch repair protein, C-terminal domain